MPSRTSSSALSAAARLSSSGSDTCGSNGPYPGCDPFLVAEHGIARDEDSGACFDHQRRRLGIDAAIDLDLDVGRHRPHAANLLGALRDELLTTESGLDGHHIDGGDVWQYLAQRLDRGRRVDRDARLGAELLDPHDCAIEGRG